MNITFNKFMFNKFDNIFAVNHSDIPLGINNSKKNCTYDGCNWHCCNEFGRDCSMTLMKCGTAEELGII